MRPFRKKIYPEEKDQNQALKNSKFEGRVGGNPAK